MDDNVYIDKGTSLIAISLYKEYRNQKIGTALIHSILVELKKRGYKQVSLGVEKGKYAIKLYKKVSFEIYCEKGVDYIMLCKLYSNNFYKKTIDKKIK